MCGCYSAIHHPLSIRSTDSSPNHYFNDTLLSAVLLDLYGDHKSSFTIRSSLSNTTGELRRRKEGRKGERERKERKWLASP
jgi:hypothetical protein